VQSVKAEYKLNERSIQKKLYLGLKLKGKKGVGLAAFFSGR